MLLRSQLTRFFLNGLLASGVHYLVLFLSINVFHLESAGMANLFSALFGTITSFFGNRYFVFSAQKYNIWRQFRKFSFFYGILILVQGFILLVWTDIYGFQYQTGFVIGVVIQTFLSYFLNKFLVFRI